MATETILIIDDDEVFARTLRRAFEGRGFHAVCALNEAEALALADSRRPTHAVLDLRLGQASGLQLIEPLLERLPALRIVVLTGYASVATAVRAVKLGAIDYLAKPVGADAILRALLDDAATVPVEPPAEPTPLKQLEWEHLQRVLAENDGNISATARQLGLHRRTLQRKLQKKPDLKRGQP